MPPWMPAEGFTDTGRGVSGKWAAQDGRVAKESVKFQQDELGNHHVSAIRERFEKRDSGLVIVVPRLEGWEQNVGIEGDHRRRRLRVVSSSAE